MSVWIPRGDMDYASEQEPENEEEEEVDDNETTSNLQEMKIVSLTVIDCCDCFGFKLRTGCLCFGNELGRPLCTQV
jgi:hypothetical protein